LYVELHKESISHRGDITRIKASVWQICYGCISVEAPKKAVSHSSDFARIETSGWQTRQCSCIVEIRKECIPYRGDITCMKASGRQIGQISTTIERSEEATSYCSTDVDEIETPGWEAGKRSFIVEGAEKVMSSIGGTISKY